MEEEAAGKKKTDCCVCFYIYGHRKGGRREQKNRGGGGGGDGRFCFLFSVLGGHRKEGQPDGERDRQMGFKDAVRRERRTEGKERK